MNTDKTTSSTRPPIAAEIMRMSKPWEIPLSSSPSVLPCTAEVGTETEKHHSEKPHIAFTASCAFQEHLITLKLGANLAILRILPSIVAVEAI